MSPACSFKLSFILLHVLGHASRCMAMSASHCAASGRKAVDLYYLESDHISVDSLCLPHKESKDKYRVAFIGTHEMSSSTAPSTNLEL